MGDNTTSAATATWSASSVGFQWFACRGAGMSETSVDNVLVALDNGVSSWDGEKTINLRGLNAPPSSVGLAAKSSLESKGVTVYVN